MHVFNVTGMTCAHCERAVTQAIKALDPQAASRSTSPLARSGRGAPSEQQIRAAIEEEGYQVR